ncbi:phage antirepressor KilAC domain-containing protein, partial [Acinetobacter baumannii]
VEYYEKIVVRDTLLNATQVAQKIGLSAIALNKLLDSLKVYSHGVKRARVFQQWFIDKGFGELKQTDLGYSQPMFTTKGEAWVIQKLVSEG